MCHPGALHTILQDLNRQFEQAALKLVRDVVDQALLPAPEPQPQPRARVRELVRRSQ